MKSTYISLLSTAFVTFTTLCIAQEIFNPSEDQKQIHAIRASGTIEIDGSLSEVDWQKSKVISSFVQIEPFQGRASTVRTEVKVIYSDKHLYVGVICWDSLGRKALRAPDLKRDFAWRAHDTFAMCFDGFGDKRNSISIVTNPYGVQRDYLSFDDTLFDVDWNGLWNVRTSISDSAWTAEFAIPWKTLRYSNNSDSLQNWGLNFLRLRRATNEISAWSAYPRSFGFNRMEYAGLLTHLNPPKPSINIQVNPYLLSSFNKTRQAGEDAITLNSLKAGGEIKWAIDPNTVLDLTYNTDFAQADADIRVNNLSRFSIFFPERRQFFLENASLFGVGLTPFTDNLGGRMILQPIFTRQIGLNNGTPIPIDFGGRIIHRSLKHNYGVVVIRQQGTSELPSTNFAIARYAYNVGKQNRVGLLSTLKHSNTNGQVGLNFVSGIDGFFRLSAAHSLRGMVLQSNTSQTANGFGGYLQYLYNTNSVQGWLTQTVVTKNFKPEVGFLSRNDVIVTSPGLFTNLRSEWVAFKKIIRAYRPGASLELYHQTSERKLIESELRVIPFWLELQSGGYLSYSIIETYQDIQNEFQPLGVKIGIDEYRYTRSSVRLANDNSRKVSYIAQVDWGNYFNGHLTTYEFNLAIAPLPHISVKTGINSNHFSKVGIEDFSKTINLYTIESRLAVNPRLQFSGLYQHNTQDKLRAYNLRISWEYKPLSYVYLVFNSRATVIQDIERIENSGILKLTYLKQF